MPFLEPIVYPPERNKDYIKQAIYVANSLGSWWRRINEQKKIKKIKIRFSTAIVVVHSINQTTILTRSQQKAKPAKPENSQKMSHLEIKTQIIVTSNLNINTPKWLNVVYVHRKIRNINDGNIIDTVTSMNQPHQIIYPRNGKTTLLMNLSCSSACLAILTACLERISFVWTACFDNISLVWATFYKTKQTQIAKKTNKTDNPRFKTSRFLISQINQLP
jgi:hypothetical protein